MKKSRKSKVEGQTSNVMLMYSKCQNLCHEFRELARIFSRIREIRATPHWRSGKCSRLKSFHGMDTIQSSNLWLIVLKKCSLSLVLAG